MQGFHVEGRMLRYVRINVTFVEGKVGEEITFLECQPLVMKHSPFHAYCEAMSCRERACNLQLGDLGCNSSFALTSSVILEQYFF